MYLQIGALIEKMKSDIIKDLYIRTSDTQIRSAKLLLKNQTSFQHDVLYLGRISELPGNLPASIKLNLLCIGDTHTPVDYINNKNLNLILANAEADISELFNKVQDVLMDSYYIIQSSAALFNNIIRGKGLQYIMEIGSGLLGNPIMMGDSNHRLLAYSKDENIDDPAWIEFRDKGYCTYEYTTKYGFDKWIEKEIQSKTPIIGDLGAISKKRRIFSKIVIDDAIVGHLAVLENNKPFTQRDIEITSFICDVIAAEMQRNVHFRNTRSVMLENLILDLLDGKKMSGDRLHEKIKFLSWKPKEKLYVLSIKYNTYESTFSLMSFIRDSLGEMMVGERAFFYNGYLVFIVGCSKVSRLTHEKFAALMSFLKGCQLCAGLSNGFEEITDLHKFYKQSLKAITLGQKIDKSKVLYIYENYMIYHMIDICGREQDIRDFCHPAIARLQEYDALHKSDYVRSLYTYLLNARNLISTADSLFIHRNTISYRLDKIQEITGIELDNDDVVMNLFVSYQVLKYASVLK